MTLRRGASYIFSDLCCVTSTAFYFKEFSNVIVGAAHHYFIEPNMRCRYCLLSLTLRYQIRVMRIRFIVRSITYFSIGPNLDHFFVIFRYSYKIFLYSRFLPSSLLVARRLYGVMHKAIFVHSCFVVTQTYGLLFYAYDDQFDIYKSYYHAVPRP